MQNDEHEVPAGGGVVHDQQWWEERYRSAPMLFSGHANTQLIAEVASLPPGRALDAGCGEGGDALWLAGHGWQVDAVDISTVALGRAAEAAEHLGLAGRIRFQQADLTDWNPSSEYDLVSSFYVHPPSAARAELYAKLAAVVAPAGILLVVQHDPHEAAVAHPDLADLLATPEQLAAGLDPRQWDILTVATRPRETGHLDHEAEVMAHDAVLVARRR